VKEVLLRLSARALGAERARAWTQRQRWLGCKYDRANRLAIFELERGVEATGQTFHRGILRVGRDAQPLVAKCTRSLDETREKQTAQTAVLKLSLYTERDFPSRFGIIGTLVKLRRAKHFTVLDITDDERSILKATIRVSGDERIVGRTVESVTPALSIKSQQMRLELWLFGMSQEPDCTRQGSHGGLRGICHVASS
jgi:hypothetical protein